MTDRTGIEAAPPRAKLEALLSERNSIPERAGQIDQKIESLFGRELAVLVLDMCNFTEVSAAFGIIHYLAMVQAMVQAATPVITANHGIVLKQEADDLFAAFPTAQAALEGAIRVRSVLQSISSADCNLCGCIGIGFGRAILIEDKDAFGNEVNLACKLGEDLAIKNEILLTSAARAALGSSPYRLRAQRYQLSGIEIEAFRFEGYVDCSESRADDDVAACVC